MKKKINFNNIVKKIKIFSEIALGITAGFSIVALITTLGFYISLNTIQLLTDGTSIVLAIFVIQEVLRFIFAIRKRQHFFERWFEIGVSIVFVFLLFNPHLPVSTIWTLFPNMEEINAYSINLTILNSIIIIIFIIKGTKYVDSIMKLNLHPSAIFALSFAAIILTGSLFLTLPKATVSGESTSYIDALFTSTSAVCVTGLVVENTATHFTLFGKIIILLLIQIGGLGVMTLTTFFASIVAGGLSVKIRFLMKEYLSQLNAGNISKLILKILYFTLFIELMGAVILFLLSDNQHYNGIYDKMFQSVFHSVSAFCNAGFSTFNMNLMEDFILNNPLYPTIIMLLIIFGGLGFPVLLELSNYFKKGTSKNLRIFFRDKLSASTKIVLITTTILIFGGGFGIFIFMYFSNTLSPNWLMDAFHSIFLSVSSRTAGFNTNAIELLSYPVVFIIIFLMWVGASPGGTGGGIKTTTFTITFMSLFNTIRGKERMEFFKREISQKNINSAFQVLIANIFSLSVGILLLLIFEMDKQPIDLVFEAVSAASTVGLSRNLSPFLGDGGKMVIILLMFVGRVGFLNFFLAFYRPNKEPEYHYKTDNIMVG